MSYESGGQKASRRRGLAEVGRGLASSESPTLAQLKSKWTERCPPERPRGYP